MNLDGSVKGADLNNVLQSIQHRSYFDEIENLNLKNNGFDSSLNSAFLHKADFPPNLKILDLSNNKLFGLYVPWDLLPAKLESIYLHNNCFEGSIDWSELPKELRVLWIYGNKFDNSIRWGQLSEFLSVIYVSKTMADVSSDDMPEPLWNKYHDEMTYVKWLRHQEKWSKWGPVFWAMKEEEPGYAVKEVVFIRKLSLAPDSLSNFHRAMIKLTLFNVFITLVVLPLLVMRPKPPTPQTKN